MAMIEKPEWWSICENAELCERFREVAKSFTRNPELREDLYQEAWLAICEYLSGIGPVIETYKGGAAAGVNKFLSRDQHDIEFYFKIGSRAMDRLRKKEAAYRDQFKPWIKTAAYHRVRRRFIKIKKRKSECKKTGCLVS